MCLVPFYHEQALKCFLGLASLEVKFKSPNQFPNPEYTQYLKPFKSHAIILRTLKAPPINSKQSHVLSKMCFYFRNKKVCRGIKRDSILNITQLFIY